MPILVRRLSAGRNGGSVGYAGFEPTSSGSQSRRPAKLGQYPLTSQPGRYSRTSGLISGARFSLLVLCPHQESNLGFWFRRPALYPLSYEGNASGMRRFERATPSS